MKTENVLPAHSRLLVDEERESRMSEGGIELPEDYNAGGGAPKTGVVLAAGPGEWRHGVYVAIDPAIVGRTVIYPRHAGAKLADGQRLIAEQDILGFADGGLPDIP